MITNPEVFMSYNKSMLIAPAGHGKTHSITTCLAQATGRQLVLTHTHAGVGSIRGKVAKEALDTSKFHVETIMSYAQKYVEAYYCGKDVPDREDTAAYYSFIIQKATRIMGLQPIAMVLKNSYSGIFVDEYQDCTMAQHELILALGRILPVRILGDPMQGIFNFDNTPMVDLDSKDKMAGFHANRFELTIPWRWKDINDKLGGELQQIRQLIVARKQIDLSLFTGIEFIPVADELELYNPKKEYYKKLAKLLQQENILLIHPDSTSIYPRKKLVGVFNIPINLLESIDDKDFYNLARMFDNATAATMAPCIGAVCLKLFNKTGVGKWFNEKGLVNKKNEAEKIKSQEINGRIQTASNPVSFKNIAEVLRYIFKLSELKCHRKELYYSLVKALEEATLNKSSVFDAMVSHRNLIRRMGRRVVGRCIGTTLLTKGLEFETVVILNAHAFKCPKNLYVALTRASKRLIVFSKNSVLSPAY